MKECIYLAIIYNLTYYMFRSKLLLTTNIITATLLIVVLIIAKYPQRVYNRIDALLKNRPLLKPHSFFDNKSYLEQTDFYTTYVGQKNIVMLGNSLTYRINWPELLKRTDIANRGIASDITLGFIHRLNFVLNLNPKICFIEGGVNDLSYSFHKDTTIKNLKTIVDTLLKSNIKPVLTTVNYVASNYIYHEAKSFNKKIKELNKDIIKLASEKKVSLIDLNPYLTDGEFLRTEYANDDGIHFTSKAYLIWKDEITKILEQEKF